MKRTKKPVVVEHIRYDKDGSKRNIEVHGYPILDSEGNVAQMIEHALDITERKQAEQRIETLSVFPFLASMSHELRTPLNAILGFSQVLQGKYFGKPNQKQKEYMNYILESGNHLLSLINNIPELSQIESGKVKLELTRINVKDLVESSLVIIKEKTSQHKISLELFFLSNWRILRLEQISETSKKKITEFIKRLKQE